MLHYIKADKPRGFHELNTASLGPTPEIRKSSVLLKSLYKNMMEQEKGLPEILTPQPSLRKAHFCLRLPFKGRQEDRRRIHKFRQGCCATFPCREEGVTMEMNLHKIIRVVNRAIIIHDTGSRI